MKLSYIMPTANRRRFVARSISLWQRQTYEDRELCILDDGEDAIEDLVPKNDPRIRYERLSSRVVLGEKRNLLCEMSTGEVIAHWDDDDWYHPEYGVSLASVVVGDGLAGVLLGAALVPSGGADIAALSDICFFEERTGRIMRLLPSRPPPPPAVPRSRARHAARIEPLGSTLCYRREHWAEHPFQKIACGEDTKFYKHPLNARVVGVAGFPYLSVAFTHDRNTSSRVFSGRRYRPADKEVLARLEGAGFAVGTRGSRPSPG